jgi:hypothetical protein
LAASAFLTSRRKSENDPIYGKHQLLLIQLQPPETAMTQYFYVDESGEPGLRHPASSHYYVFVMAQLPNREAIPDIVALRQQLSFSSNFEFHFYKMTSRQKELFFQTIQPLEFRVCAAVLLKENLPPYLRGLNGTQLAMELLIRLTLRASPLDIANDMILDGAPENFLKNLRIQLSQACKRAGRERPFKKLVTSNSRYDDGLQLADMLAGAIRQQVWAKETAYAQTFSKKVADLWLVD